MRKLIVWMSVSLDGYMEGRNRELTWNKIDDEFLWHVNEVLAGMGAFLFGRVTYELMTSAWPAAGQDPASPEPMKQFAGIWLDMPKIVYSRTLKTAGANTTIVREVVADEVRALKAQPGGDLVLGGADIAAAFQALDLVDEYRLYVHPVVIRAGKPLFAPSGRPIDLRLVETRTFGTGIVMLRYERPLG